MASFSPCSILELTNDRHSALFIFYEFMLGHTTDPSTRYRILHSIEDTSLRVLAFAHAAYSDRAENYPSDTISPYLPYSLFQAATVQFRLWKQRNDSACQTRFETLNPILQEFTHRWMVACKLNQNGLCNDGCLNKQDMDFVALVCIHYDT